MNMLRLIDIVMNSYLFPSDISQDAQKFEDRQEICGQSIVVEWARGPKRGVVCIYIKLSIVNCSHDYER